MEDMEAASVGAQQRDEAECGHTTSVCTHCAVPVPADIFTRGGSVYLRKSCSEHGEHEELLEEDASWYLRRLEFDQPGTATLHETTSGRGCPWDCGICPEHQQHTCIALLEITGRCDLNCPVCYAGAGSGPDLDLETAGRMMDHYQEAEGGAAEILQISGGEPTMHRDVLEIIRMARDRGIRYVMLNTNGLRIAREKEFAEALGQFHGGFEVYLQFDGPGREASKLLRGRDVVDQKQRALEHLAESGVPVTLVCTLHGGVNDTSIGQVIRFGLEHPTVRGINFQPLTLFGRTQGIRPEDRLTLSGVLRRIEAQMGGMLKVSDFIPLPCDVERVAISYLYRRSGSFYPLARRMDLRDHLPSLANTLAFYPQDTLRAMLSSACGSGCRCMSLVKDILPFAGLGVRAAASRDRVEFTTSNFFRITVTSFLDRYSFDIRALQKECVHVLTPDLRRIPFSAFNMFHRGRYG